MEQNEVASDRSHGGATTATIVAHEILLKLLYAYELRPTRAMSLR
jgi:hypothetical protein